MFTIVMVDSVEQWWTLVSLLNNYIALPSTKSATLEAASGVASAFIFSAMRERCSG